MFLYQLVILNRCSCRSAPFAMHACKNQKMPFLQKTQHNTCPLAKTHNNKTLKQQNKAKQNENEFHKPTKQPQFYCLDIREKSHYITFHYMVFAIIAVIIAHPSERKDRTNLCYLRAIFNGFFPHLTHFAKNCYNFQ